MADLKITELAALAGGDLSSGDLLAVADISASETKKITVVDLFGKGVTLIADATIPGAKVLFGAGTLAGSAIANGGISATQLADNAVTAAKLGDESTVDLVTTLPGSGAFVGQIALDTDDNKAHIWNGSSWVSFKAAGSINTVVGGTAGLVNLSVTTSGDTVTINTFMDASTSAAQFLAGPTLAAGAVSYRQIASGDMPTATTGGKGAVVVNGAGLAMSGDQIVIDNTVAANSATYHVVKYSDKGLVVDGRFITADDLPEATSVDKGAVLPGSGLSVAAGGTLDHTNSVTAGAATKITFDAEGHVTASQSLLDTDIPDLPASKLTSGTISASVIGINTITGNKLANASITKFGGAASTTGIVEFPPADFAGQYFFDSINGDLYLWDGNAWQPITITSGEIVFGGTYNATTNLVASTTTAGTAAGLTAGSALPAAAAENSRYYVVVSIGGTGVSPAPTVALAAPDMLLSNGTAWQEIDVSTTVSAQAASNITFTPTGTISSNNVQTALVELDTEKLALAGGTVTGELLIGAAGSLVLEGSTADGFETTIAVVDPTADRTITLPNVTGTVITTGDSGTVTSTMIADGTILNADINASAAIVDTKLATIATAGKVNNSATTATNANTPGAIVARDPSGNFSANTITASLTGTASNVTTNANLTGDVTSVGNATSIAAGVIVDADINASAGIADTKLATISTAGKVSGSAITSGTIDTSGDLSITNVVPSVLLTESDGTATHSQTIMARNINKFQIQTRSSAGVFLSSDYEVPSDASGATDHIWRIANTEKARLNSSGLTVVNDLTISDKIIHAGDTNTAIRFPAADTVTVETNGSERTRVDSSGRLLVGTSTAQRDSSAGRFPQMQLNSSNSSQNSSTFGIYANSPSANCSINLYRNRATTAGGFDYTGGTVQAGDVLGQIAFLGVDGQATPIMRTGATIDAVCESTPTTAEMPSNLVFSTTADGSASPTERMRINSGGQVMINTTTDDGSGGVVFVPATFGRAVVRSGTSTTTAVQHYQFYNPNGVVGSISTNGSATAYNTSSDYRLKENITLLDGAIARLNQLPVHRFNFIADPDTVVDGFIAHEAAAVVPECVTGEKDEVDENDDPVYQGIDQSKIVPLLTAALQEAIAKIDALEARITALEA